MIYTTIIYNKQDHVATITLNRPEEDNLINQKLAQEMADACRRINQDDDVYVAVITATGGKALCR